MIKQHPTARVIVDNDFAGDPDGLFALAHQWLSPTARTVLVTTTALDTTLAALAGQPAGRTAAQGRDLALQLARTADLDKPCPVVGGAEGFGIGEAQHNPAAHAIVAEAMRDDALPLLVTCGGPLTNVAAALRLAPDIAKRMTVVWVGAALDETADPEYNLATDTHAARQVLCHASLPLQVIPRETYQQLKVSVAELTADLRPISGLSRWLYARYLHLPPFVQLGPTITLGDSALVHAAILDRDAPLRSVSARPFQAQTGGALTDDARRDLLVWDRVDARAVMADLLAKLRLNAEASAG